MENLPLGSSVLRNLNNRINVLCTVLLELCKMCTILEKHYSMSTGSLNR